MDRNQADELQQELRLARDTYIELLHQLTDLNGEIVTRSLPQPDGSQAVANLGRQLHIANERYRAALKAVVESTRGERAMERGDDLTPRELQVLTLIASGESSKEISRFLGISFRTVICHRGHLMTKLSARNVADLTRAAIRRGLVRA